MNTTEATFISTPFIKLKFLLSYI